MRIRTVKPEMWEDEKIACLSRDARLMFIGCFNLADDEGLLRWTPAYIKSGLFMYDDDLGLPEIQALMEEVTQQSLILEYSPAAGKGSVKQRLAWIIKFRVHQKINRPQASRLPPPSVQNRLVQAAYAQRDNHVCHLCNGPVNETRFTLGDPYSSSSPDDIESLNASLDHIVPRTKGGGDHPTNIALAHIGCNKGRRERPISEFKVPPSVRSALISVGWVSDHDVNDSLNDSLNDSPLDREGDREGDRDQGKDDEGERERPLPPEPDDPYAGVVVVPEYVDSPSRPSRPNPGSGSKAVVRQVLGNAYPRTITDRLAVQVEKLAREGQPDNLIRQSIVEWDRRDNCEKPEYLPTVLGDLVKQSRAAPPLSAADSKVNDWLALANKQPHLKAINE